MEINLFKNFEPAFKDEILLAFENWDNNAINHIAKELNYSKGFVHQVINERYN